MPRLSNQYIVDDKGRKKAIVLPLKEYRQLLERIEELEDALALDEAVQNAQEFTDYAQVREELKREGKL